MDNTSDNIRRLIAAASEEMETFARTSFASDGRGVIMVEFPDVEPERAIVATSMVYHQLEHVRRLTAGTGDDADVLVRMIETYDPDAQALVLATVGRSNPISLKWRFNAAVAPSLFPAWESFMREHEDCPDDPNRLRFHVWMPPETDHCRVTFTCICGARIVVPGKRVEGLAIVASCRKSGIPVVESGGAEGVH